MQRPVRWEVWERRGVRFKHESLSATLVHWGARLMRVRVGGSLRDSLPHELAGIDKWRRDGTTRVHSKGLARNGDGTV